MRKSLSVTITAVMLFSFSLPARSQSQPALSEAVQVTVVEVPVNVVDKSGNSVRGLTRQNFELIDQGQKRTIDYFETIDLTRVSGQEPTGVPLNPASRRSFAVMFDLSSTSPQHLGRAREAATNFVTSGMEPRDLGAIVTFTVEQGFRFLTTFTTDRTLLRKAIDTIGNPKMLGANDPLLLFPSSEPGMAASKTSGTENSSMADQEFQEMGKSVQKNNEEYRKQRVSRQLQNFSIFARTLDRLRGRKQVILLSEGFDARLITGRENVNSADAQADAAASVSGEIWKVDNDARFGNNAASNQLKQMFDYFKRSDVVLHAVDVQGLRSGSDARSGATSPSTESLFLLSSGTGGQLFKNMNDVGEGFARLLKQQEVIYVLGFQAPAGKDASKFRNLKVKLVNVPGGARAFHRAGYYEAPTTTALEQALSATEIMMNDIEQNDVGMNVVSSPFPLATTGNQVPVVIEIDGPTLMEGIKGNTLNGELLIYAFDEQNAVKDFLYQRLALDLSKVRPALSKAGLKYYGTLALPPGNYRLRTLLRVDESKRNGYRSSPLQVPDFNSAVALPPFFFEDGGGWIMVKGASRVQGAVDYPFIVGAESFVPSAQPKLNNDSAYKVALFTYNLPAETMELVARVRDQKGATQNAKVALVGRTPTGPKGSTKLLFNFTPTGLSPGRYTLEFAVKQKGAAAGQVVSMPFVLN